jgi:hypothetical protein
MATRAVTCESCGVADEITEPADPAVEIRWQCGTCKHPNLIEGHPGEPGEGALNPAAAGLTDDEVLEAAVRRGLTGAGDATPAGDVTTASAPLEGGQQ